MSDWDQEPKKKVRRPWNTGQVVSVAGLSLAFCGLLLGLYLKKPPPRRAKKEAAPKAPMIEGERRRRKPVAKKEEKPTQEFRKRLASLSQELLQLAPHIYEYIRLEMLNGQYLDEDSDLSGDLETSSVRTVDIHVKSLAWDKLGSSEKVDLLNRTFELLKTRYPDITQFVNLKFDDGRLDLDLKFQERL